MGTSELLRYYAASTATSDLGHNRALAAELPRDTEALGEIVRGLLVHNYKAKVRGLELTPERMSQMRTASAERILDNVVRLDSRPLAIERPLEQQMVGFCYHFALLHCALLRNAEIPARARCGFARYFIPDRWTDHWVVEWWDGDGWRLHDTQTGSNDLSDEDFRDGVAAWVLCRSDPSQVGRYGNGELWGWDELRGSLINDVAALNKIEVSGWYWCDRINVDPIDEPHDDLDASLDVLARRVSTATSVTEIEQAYELYPELQTPPDAVAM
ncbi:MAG: transglutaminase-like domain-containing protein [Acidimicrobiales bacterium]